MSYQNERVKAMERDGEECSFCGVSNEQHRQEYDQSLETHHILKDRLGGSDNHSNLVTVCKDCHRTLEETQARGLEELKGCIESQHPDLREAILYAISRVPEQITSENRDSAIDIDGRDSHITIYTVVESPKIGEPTIRYTGISEERAMKELTELDSANVALKKRELSIRKEVEEFASLNIEDEDFADMCVSELGADRTADELEGRMR